MKELLIEIREYLKKEIAYYEEGAIPCGKEKDFVRRIDEAVKEQRPHPKDFFGTDHEKFIEAINARALEGYTDTELPEQTKTEK